MTQVFDSMIIQIFLLLSIGVLSDSIEAINNTSCLGEYEDKLKDLIDCTPFDEIPLAKQGMCEKFLVTYNGNESLFPRSNKSLGVYEYVGTKKSCKTCAGVFLKKDDPWIYFAGIFGNESYDVGEVKKGWVGLEFTKNDRVPLDDWKLVQSFSLITIRPTKFCYLPNIEDCSSFVKWQLYKEDDIETSGNETSIICVVDKNCSEPWNDIGDCSNESGLCGKDSGVQKQYRNCTNGTLELCTQEDMFQEISCDIPCTTTETTFIPRDTSITNREDKTTSKTSSISATIGDGISNYTTVSVMIPDKTSNGDNGHGGEGNGITSGTSCKSITVRACCMLAIWTISISAFSHRC